MRQGSWIRGARLVPGMTAGLALAFVLGAAPEAVEAANPERVFRGKVITSSKRIPTSAKSKRAYISKLRKLKKTRFQEDKKKKRWKVYYTAFFKQPLRSLEVTVRLYDLTEGGKRLKGTFEQYMDRRGAKSITSYVSLDRDDFGVNRHILMTFESNNRVLASTKFWILGEAEKFSGEVDFTSDD